MNNEHDDHRKEHLFIPDDQVIKLDHTLTGRNTERDVLHTEHGQSLVTNLTHIESVHKKSGGPLANEFVVYKVSLAPKVHLHNKTTREFLESSGLTIHAVKNDNTAVVSTPTEKWNRLHMRVEEYKKHRSYNGFQDVQQFLPWESDDKASESIKRILRQTSLPIEPIDVQIALLPKMTYSQQQKVINFITQKAISEQGAILEEPYFLHDGTPVIRAQLPAEAISFIASEETVYRVSKTDFFTSGVPESTPMDVSTCTVNQDIEPSELPIVVVLDSGVDFPKNLEPFVVEHWTAPGVGACDNRHGTAVSARVLFGNDLRRQISVGLLEPRTRIVDAQISDGKSMSPKQFMDRITAAVLHFKDTSKIFNLSYNAGEPIDGDEISFIAADIDALAQEHGVQFVISSGNHTLWAVHSSLEDILDDDDSRISSPADAVLAVTVGAIMTEDKSGSLSKANEVSPFSRVGPGFSGITKPDVVAPGGSCQPKVVGVKIEPDPFDTACAQVLLPGAKIGLDVGTSYAAPIVAGDLAQIINHIPATLNQLLLAKALLIHTADPMWDLESLDEDELEELIRRQGYGKSNVERALQSNTSSVSFVRTGTLDRVSKERVKFYVPSILAQQTGLNIARVTVTVVSQPDVDRTKGTEYCKSYVRASLKKSDKAGRLLNINPGTVLAKDKWQACQHYSKLFSRFEPGDWQVWLQPFARWDTPNDQPIPYALVVTVEDPSGQLDLYSNILQESRGRFQPMVGTRVRV